MTISNIGVINDSTTTSDSDVASWAAACQEQMRRDVAPIWSIPWAAGDLRAVRGSNGRSRARPRGGLIIARVSALATMSLPAAHR
jgi:hypothetical protein